LSSNLAENLSSQNRENAVELAKCMNGFSGLSHWINTYVKIQDRKSKKDIPFHLWPGQEQVIPYFLDELYLCVLKARQLGLTWLCAAYALWRAIFHSYELIIIISAREDLAIEFLDRVKFMFDRLPIFMQPPVYKRSTTELSFGYEVKDDQGNIALKGLNSTIKSLPATPDAGQSKTISLLIMDESALNRYCREIWAAASPTLEHAAGRAIIISNPSKNRPGWPWTRDLYTNAMKGLNTFKRVFLSWAEVPGRGEDFLQLKATQEGLDEEDLSMQYPTTEDEAISVLGGSYFGKTLVGFNPDKGDRGYLEDVDGEFMFVHDIKGTLEVWDEPDNTYTNRYAIGSDVSEGLGDTFSVAYVYDRMEHKFVARLRSSRIDADVWATRLAELGTYYGSAMIGPERNGAGITTVIHLQEIYQNLFYRKKPGKMKGQYVLEYGWSQTNENKQVLADELKRHFRLIFTACPCGILLDEASTFIRHENGKIGHEEGKYDDCVIAAGLSLQVSLLMGEMEDMTPKPKKSQWDLRLDELEAGDLDDFENFVEGNVTYNDL
jgi:hypothetical protein